MADGVRKCALFPAKKRQRSSECNPLQQIAEAPIIAQRIEPRIGFDERKRRRALVTRFGQTGKRLIQLPQTDVDESKIPCGDVTLFCERLQLSKDSVRFVLISCHTVRMRQ